MSKLTAMMINGSGGRTGKKNKVTAVALRILVVKYPDWIAISS
jgi:hypothetical protein